MIIAATSLSSVQSRQIPGETVIRRILADVSRSVLGSPPEVDLKFTADASNVSSLVICIVVGLSPAKSPCLSACPAVGGSMTASPGQ